MSTLLSKYVWLTKRSMKRFDNRGRPWSEYVIDILLIAGIPLSLFFCLITILVAAGVGSVKVGEETVSGTDAVLPGLGAALITVPLGCMFIGTIAYLMHEKLKVL